MAKTVLIVDDSSTVREHLSGVLAAAGYTVIEASDGQQGLDRISSEDGIALVLCDVHMPSMDGVEMVSKVKRDTRHAALPIIMLTAETDPRVIERAKSAGVKGWIVKPVKPELLVATVRRLIGP
jgi:two-component system chemotaxis response regulator CheY